MINKTVVSLFNGCNETMILSCLQGHMGHLAVDNSESPLSARIIVGDFCFFAGIPNEKLIAEVAAPILIPQNIPWCRAIENVYGDNVKKASRYSIKKEPDVFNINKLKKFIVNIPDGFKLQPIDENIYDTVIREDWSRDLCAVFNGKEDYLNRGIGFLITKNGVPVSGASSYTIYNGGIEIEIDTKPEYRRIGLATICGAKLIIECLKRKLYPSWDAHNLNSVALAEKLGYNMDSEYTVYIRQ